MTTKERRAKFRPAKKLTARNQMVALYGRSCWLCGRGIALGDTISIDHVRPLSKGGSNKIHNLRPAHERCNRKRGNGGVPVLTLSSDMRIPTIPKIIVQPIPEPIVCSSRTPDRGIKKLLQLAPFRAMRNAMLKIASTNDAPTRGRSRGVISLPPLR